ncbi:MAG: type III pantothenate kinase [Opitutales bacterium]
MDVLCFDIGNTHAHWGVVRGREVLRRGELMTGQLDVAAVQGVLDACPTGGVALASVVPAATQVVVPALSACGRGFHHLRHDTVVGLGFDYPEPSEVGQDRLADCVGAQFLVGPPAVVVGMGTATTVDILTDKGYAGGIIAPGLGVMTRYLHERTALLPPLDPARLLGGPAVGRSTVDAMRAGCSIGFSGMIGALLDAVTAELGRGGAVRPAVIFTGGASEFLPDSWRPRVRHEPDLTLIGLAESYRRARP